MVVLTGRSTAAVCGVRDYGAMLARGLAGREQQRVELCWEDGRSSGLRAGARLLESVLAEMPDAEASVVVLNYSVFAFSFKGVPLGVPAMARRLRDAAVPVVCVAHEFAYPWGRRGLVGLVHAVTQRMALIPLVRVCSALVVTTEERADWVRSRWWLARRSVAVAPVSSNLPTDVRAKPSSSGPQVAMFGYDRDRRTIELVCTTLAACRTPPAPILVLVGAPGPDSACADRWRAAADRHGCRVEFTGVLAPRAAAEALVGSDIVLFADRQGPTSRRTTLAAALGLGCCVLAVAGPDTWPDLVDAGAVVVVEGRPAALGGKLDQLLADPALRRSVGQRGASFYAARMSPEVVASIIEDVVCRVSEAGSPPAGRHSPGRFGLRSSI